MSNSLKKKMLDIEKRFSPGYTKNHVKQILENQTENINKFHRLFIGISRHPRKDSNTIRPTTN